MEIAIDSAPLFNIALPAKPTPAEEFAADELRRHLLAMLGLPPVMDWSGQVAGKGTKVTLHINCRDQERKAGLDVKLLAPGIESFHLAPVGSNYFILGGGTRGTLYAVYELLDRLGCRWFTPQVARIPRQDRLVLPDKPISGRPAFEYRDLLSWDCQDPLWALRNRLNGKFQTVPAFLGGKIEWGYFVHTLFELVPPSRYFKAHPEYYSEIAGVRRHVAAQLCLSNPQVLRIATQSVLARMREQPDATLFSVSQQDWDGYCQCAKCRRAAAQTGSQSGLFIRFVNAIAARTVREFPGKLVSTLAYTYTEPPPRRPMRLHPNVRVQMCPISTCQIHPFEACGSEQDARFLKNFRGWTAMTDQLYIWHYATDFWHYYMPLPNLRQLHANVRFYKRHGVRGVFIQANGFSELSGLKGYLMARQLWNPDMALDTVLDEFLPAVYGEAASDVRAYIDLFQAAADRARTQHPGCCERPDHPFYTDALLEAASARLIRGERRARGAARERVQLLRSAVDLAVLFRQYNQRPFRRASRVFHNAAKPADVRRFRSAIAIRQNSGNLPLCESHSLEYSAGLMGRWFERHLLVELKAGKQRLFVAPSLGGRILEWHWGDRQLLEPPDPANRHLQYPMSEGYAELAIEPPYGFKGCVENYTVRSREGDSIQLAAEVGGGFRMEREIRLVPGGIHIRSMLVNASGATRLRQWGGALHLRLADWTRLTVETAAGAQCVMRSAAPAGAVTYDRAIRPSGSWRLEFGAHALSASFSPESVAALIVERDDAKCKLAVDLRSETIAFAPGQAFTVEQDFRLE